MQQVTNVFFNTIKHHFISFTAVLVHVECIQQKLTAGFCSSSARFGSAHENTGALPHIIKDAQYIGNISKMLTHISTAWKSCWKQLHPHELFHFKTQKSL